MEASAGEGSEDVTNQEKRRPWIVENWSPYSV
jgi:hypothetical protein